MTIIDNYSKDTFNDIIQPNTLIHGDCLDVMNHIPDCSVDMILCDLPYGTTACAWDSVIPFVPMWGGVYTYNKR